MRLVRALQVLPHGAAHDEALQRLSERAPTLELLLTSDLELLARECGLEHSGLKQLTMELAVASTRGITSARTLHADHLTQNVILSTGVPALDALLQGGLQTGEVPNASRLCPRWWRTRCGPT